MTIMKTQEARELAKRVAALVQTGQPDEACALLAPLLAERLFLKTYDLELEQAKDHRIWAYRKTAWTVDEWPESIAEIYQARGEAGLRELPGVGKSLAGEIARRTP